MSSMQAQVPQAWITCRRSSTPTVPSALMSLPHTGHMSLPPRSFQPPTMVGDAVAEVGEHDVGRTAVASQVDGSATDVRGVSVVDAAVVDSGAVVAVRDRAPEVAGVVVREGAVAEGGEAVVVDPYSTAVRQRDVVAEHALLDHRVAGCDVHAASEVGRVSGDDAVADLGIGRFDVDPASGHAAEVGHAGSAGDGEAVQDRGFALGDDHAGPAGIGIDEGDLGAVRRSDGDVASAVMTDWAQVPGPTRIRSPSDAAWTAWGMLGWSWGT